MRKIYYYSKWLNYIFWERVAESTLITESSLGIFRWIFGIALLLFFVPHFGWISQAPDVFFYPPYLSLSNSFTEFPVDLLFYSIDILIIFSALFVTLGVKTRLFNLILIICWLLIACLFHLSNTLLLNIPFLNHFLVYLVFVDFSQFRKLNIDNIFFTYNKLKYFLSGLVFVLFFAHLLQKIYGQTLNFFPGDMYLYNSVIIWIFAAIVIFLNILVVNNKDVV